MWLIKAPAVGIILAALAIFAIYWQFNGNFISYWPASQSCPPPSPCQCPVCSVCPSTEAPPTTPPPVACQCPTCDTSAREQGGHLLSPSMTARQVSSWGLWNSVWEKNSLPSYACPATRKTANRKVSNVIKYSATARQLYLRQKGSVDGWMADESAYFAAFISELQRKWQVNGNVAEIGVHHGKFFAALALNADVNETLFAIDVFEQQSLNVDGSGRGKELEFLNKMSMFSLNTSQLTLIRGSSLNLLPGDERFGGEPFRLFSVDGGHTREITFHDMILAGCSLAEGGVIALDDIYSATWSGVRSGAELYMLIQSEIQPFFFDGWKMWFTTKSFHGRYIDAIKAAHLAGTGWTFEYLPNTGRLWMGNDYMMLLKSGRDMMDLWQIAFGILQPAATTQTPSNGTIV